MGREGNRMSEPNDATDQDARAHEVRRQELWSAAALAAVGKTDDPAAVANATLKAFDTAFGPDLTQRGSSHGSSRLRIVGRD
jgi:hypothetical protein